MSQIQCANLWQMKRGIQSVIEGFTPALDAAVIARLEELGFHQGARVLCTQAPRLGAPKLYKVGNAVYSLEKTIAECVIAHPVTSE
ncbi:FeoA family protein [Marinobacterium sp. xm-a-152]|uniref:FeoA family protein n=1 Tax=Marinobacterium sp. xm-a-152 TaxID=2497733 RepID=UPI001A0386B5|nr:FeoA family protein [Marinobacterium sp. xm-a-152]NRP15665.1 FeoA domain protein [Marinobacterium sp. xm-a-152]